MRVVIEDTGDKFDLQGEAAEAVLHICAKSGAPGNESAGRYAQHYRGVLAPAWGNAPMYQSNAPSGIPGALAAASAVAPTPWTPAGGPYPTHAQQAQAVQYPAGGSYPAGAPYPAGVQYPGGVPYPGQGAYPQQVGTQQGVPSSGQGLYQQGNAPQGSPQLRQGSYQQGVPGQGPYPQQGGYPQDSPYPGRVNPGQPRAIIAQPAQGAQQGATSGAFGRAPVPGDPGWTGSKT